MIAREPALALSDTVKDLPVFCWQNRISSIATGTQDASYPTANLLNPATHLKWRASGTADDRIVANVGTTVDYVALAKHNFSGRTLTIAFDYPGTFIMTHVPTDNAPIIIQFVPRAVSNIVVFVTGGGDPIECAVVYVGSTLTLERSVKIDVNVPPIALAIKSNVVNGMSESGNFTGRVLRNLYSETHIEFAHFVDTWYLANMVPFVTASRTLPFFMALIPNRYPAEVGYCWLTKDAIAQFNPTTQRFNLDLDMRAVV